eukprot:5846237-Pleurochrysis_carterae.AAC.1
MHGQGVCKSQAQLGPPAQRHSGEPSATARRGEQQSGQIESVHIQLNGSNLDIISAVASAAVTA